MPYAVRQNAGSGFDELGRRIEELLPDVLPFVQSVTALPVPDDFTIRLMKVPAWLKLRRRELRQFLVREGKELEPSLQRMAQARRAMKERHRQLAASWVMIGAQAVQDKHGRPHLLILPEALTQAGLLASDDFLCKTLGHELTHLAQHEASNGRTFTLQDSFFPDIRRTQNLHWPFLAEGHAIWADQQITTKLLGYEVPLSAISNQASPKYLDALRRVTGREEASQMYRDGARAVGDIVQAHGVETFNRVWSEQDLLLVPTFHHAENPSEWLQRFANAGAGTRS